jgi:hypothetical protein
VQQRAQQLAQHHQHDGHCGRRGQHFALYLPLGGRSREAVISRNGTRASFGPTPISSINNVSIAPAAVIDV